MFRFRTLAVVATLAAVSASSFAQDDQHKAHHPAGAASAAMPAPATGKPAGMPDMAMMDKHMKAMQAMPGTCAARTAAAAAVDDHGQGRGVAGHRGGGRLDVNGVGELEIDGHGLLGRAGRSRVVAS